MKTLYLDLVGGASGDMFVGALLDLGVELADLEQQLSGLKVGGYHLHARKDQRRGITGIKFDVHLESNPDEPRPDSSHAPHTGHAHPHPHHHGHEAGHSHTHGHAHGGFLQPLPRFSSNSPTQAAAAEHAHRDFGEIRRLLEASPLGPWVKEKATAVFRRIATAEGKIHGVPAEQVHFHEVGAVDSIVDIVAACVGLDLLGRPRLLASRVVDGSGWVDCAHGRFPVPAPATLEILAARGVTVSQCDEPHERVTPTGAALLAEFAETFGPMQDLRIEKVGYGLGGRDHPHRPNVLRAILGESMVPAEDRPAHDWDVDEVVVLETNLDDLNPEVLGHFSQRALALGALDVFHTSVQMKKGRPGTLLTILCEVEAADRFSALLLTETSAFGVRRTRVQRRKLRRATTRVATAYGEITVKVGRLDGRQVQWAPEFESCRLAAEQHGIPMKTVYEAAVRAAPDERRQSG